MGECDRCGRGDLAAVRSAPDAAALALWLDEAVLASPSQTASRATHPVRAAWSGRSELLLERLASGEVSAVIRGNGEG
jgi:hypothetical protein